MAWPSAFLESKIQSASPLERVVMLYDCASGRLAEARIALRDGDLAGKGTAISKAAAIFAELQRTLDMESGGELAGNLDRLYEYLQLRLLYANAHQDESALTEVESLIISVGDAWRSIASQPTISLLVAEQNLAASVSRGLMSAGWDG